MSLKKKGTPEKLKIVKESEIKDIAEPTFIYPPVEETWVKPKSKKQNKA